MKKEIELTELNIIVGAPKNAVGLDIDATIFYEDEPCNVTKSYSPDDFTSARRNYTTFAENPVDPDGKINIVIKIPDNAVAITLCYKVLKENYEIETESQVLQLKDIHSARDLFVEKMDDDYDAIYRFTDEFLEHLASGGSFDDFLPQDFDEEE